MRLYNDSAESRSFEGFVIHMHLAWLYLLHAEFLRDGVDYRYWDLQRKNRLLKIDGEAKRWELEVASNSVVYGSGGHVAVNVATVTV
ncbi:MAG: DUF3644 domain-containing protein [Microbacterium sp.]|nr:DUF3644 domain-containing protein [Microbacterium sp.]MBN9159103.1 DUF3644 domain-containing protein [Microbacterium sp.]